MKGFAKTAAKSDLSKGLMTRELGRQCVKYSMY